MGAPAGGPPAIASLIGHDRQQPGPQGRAVAMAIERAVGLDEPFLRRVFRVRGAAAQEVSEPHRDRLVGAHQLRVRVHVTLLGSSGELQVVEWTVLH